MTSIKTGSYQVTLAGGASFLKVNGKDWEAGILKHTRKMYACLEKEGINVCFDLLSVNLFKRRTTSESNSRATSSAIFSTKFIEVTSSKIALTQDICPSCEGGHAPKT